MNLKLKKLVGLFESRRIQAFLVTKDVNVAYLTDFPACESWLFVSPQKVFYITDFRYVLEAKGGLKGVFVKQYKTSPFDTAIAVAKSLGIKRIGFDERHLSLSQFKRMKKNCPAALKLVAANGLVETLREIKSENEIRQIRKALKINTQAYQFLKKVIKPGLSEREVLEKLEGFVKSRHVGFSFPPIIAAGPNSCFPHAKVTGRKIKNNEIVLVDLGIDVEGYKSDLTRIFFLGRIPRSVRKVFDIVRTAQQRAIEKIKPGILAADVDQEARNYLSKKGLGKFFGHSLGHGVGLEIHEGPSLSQRSVSILKEGMVVTAEPAVYIPHKYGIRVEDMVLVTKSGCSVLSKDCRL